MSINGPASFFLAKKLKSTPVFPPIPIPERRFSHFHVDIVGPLSISQGHSHILTMIDRITNTHLKWFFDMAEKV
jgi:hypothetical protein